MVKKDIKSKIKSLDKKSSFFHIPGIHWKYIYKKETFIIITLSFLFALFCREYNIMFDFSSLNTIYFLVLGFPLSLILSQAESRRFTILDHISAVKARMIALSYAYKDRIQNSSHDKKFYQERIGIFLMCFRDFLITKGSLDDYIPVLIAMEDAIHNLSLANEQMRKDKVPANEISRANQYIEKTLISLEALRSYKYYRTSKTLTSFLRIFIIVGCFIFAPYYISINPFYGLFASPFVAFSFLTLLNIQTILDDPFNRDFDLADAVNTNFIRRFLIRIDHIFNYNKEK